jgi:hypothetical protein
MLTTLKREGQQEILQHHENYLPVYVLMLVTLAFVIRKFKKANLLKWNNQQVQKFKQQQMI